MSRDMRKRPKRKNKKYGLPYDVEDNGIGQYSVDDDLEESNIINIGIDEEGNLKLPKGLSKDVIRDYLEGLVYDVLKDLMSKENGVDYLIDKQTHIKNLFRGLDEWDEG